MTLAAMLAVAVLLALTAWFRRRARCVLYLDWATLTTARPG